MKIARTIPELQAARRQLILRQYSTAQERPLVGLVPTMGALHAGHRALLERMSGECAVGIASLFVNPRQFGPGEDYGRYPRMFEADVAVCEEAGAQIVFAPTVDELYPKGYATTISISGLTERWCGASRPGHFAGVATVVAKLFTVCTPDKAYFGEKDFQQLAVVRRLAADLNLPVEVVGCPTVREPDGLALSSRNAYLTPEQRAAAPRLYQALQAMAQAFSTGQRDVASLLELGAAHIAAGTEPRFELEYLGLVDCATLEPRDTAHHGDRVLVAARLGETRLIDNLEL